MKLIMNLKFFILPYQDYFYIGRLLIRNKSIIRYNLFFNMIQMISFIINIEKV